MFFSRWTIFQVIIIAILIVGAFIADLFKSDIAVPFSSSQEINTPMILTFLFITVVIGLLNLLMYLQTKKSNTFLTHPIWDKMHILTPLLFVVSLVIIFSVFLIEPLSYLVQNNRWIMYIFIYYVLFLLNLIVLAIIHKSKKNIMSNKNKIMFSFVCTTISLFVILFIL